LTATVERRTELVGLGLGIAAGASFGTLAVLAKFAYEDGADPLPLLTARFGITALLLVGFHLVTGRRLALPVKEAWRLLALGAFGYALEASLFFFALDFAPAGVVTLIFYSYPLLTTIFAVATKLERFEPRTALALLLGTVGVAIIFSIEGGDVRGPLLACAAAVAVAVYYLFAQVVTKGIDPAASAAWTAIGATAVLSIVLTFTEWEFPAAALAPAAGLGVATAFSFVALYAAIARLGSARVAIASMFEPVTTVILAAIFLNENITVRIALGAALVIAALPILVGRGRSDDARTVAPDAL
jgi:drug/metabolite transporter (DMT)-like permease